ncbi:cytosine permease [Moorella naiadis]|uniref:cytosine permease n=1 Tax=Moorella naiadis (nom. illeg.) TaxID=3093670 RepID=UPI003D9C963E
MSESPTKEYPVEVAVPLEDRHIGFGEMVATWIGANANTGSWFVGGVVAALGFGGAVAVTLIANPIAYAIMALIGYMGYRVGTTTMGLARVPFGIKGSALPSVLNITQFIGWCAVNTFIAAISMSFLFNQLFGWPAFGNPGSWWVLVIGVLINSLLQIWLTVAGGSRSIKLFEKYAVILLAVLTVWETVAIFRTWSLDQILAWRPPAELRMPFGKAMDAMAAFSLGWVPAIAEFTRYTKNKASSTVAPMIGANFALFWFALVGTLGVIAATLMSGKFDPNMSDPSSVVGQLGLGWVAFLVLILCTVTTNVVNIYAAGMSTVNIWSDISPFKALWIVSILATIVSLIPIIIGSFLNAFILFLDYVGFIFAPLFAIMLIDYYFIRRGHYDWSQANRVGGSYWYTNGINWRAIVTWVIGAIIFLVVRNWPLVFNSIGAIYTTLIITAIIYWFVARGAASQDKQSRLTA